MKDTNRTICEVEDLRSLLQQSLSMVEDEQEADTDRLLTFDILTMPGASLEICSKELDVLIFGLEPKAGPPQIKTCFTWLFKEREVKRTLLELGRLKCNLQLALVADAAKAIFRIEMPLEEMRLESGQRAIVNWLHPVDPSVGHSTARVKVSCPNFTLDQRYDMVACSLARTVLY